MTTGTYPAYPFFWEAGDPSAPSYQLNAQSVDFAHVWDGSGNGSVMKNVHKLQVVVRYTNYNTPTYSTYPQGIGTFYVTIIDPCLKTTLKHQYQISG